MLQSRNQLANENSYQNFLIIGRSLYKKIFINEKKALTTKQCTTMTVKLMSQ